ncbi:MAG: (2Fe-2S) ferredoxin domain-containing protein, partial [Thermoanaerobaculia bacterium]
KAGCLDQCAHGVCVVVYPDAVWYGGVKPADVDEIVERHIVGGMPVTRLVIPDEQLTGLDPARRTKPDPSS